MTELTAYNPTPNYRSPRTSMYELKLPDTPFKNAEKYKFLGTALTNKIEHRGRVVCSILALYSPGPGSTFLHRDRIS